MCKLLASVLSLTSAPIGAPIRVSAHTFNESPETLKLGKSNMPKSLSREILIIC